MPHFIVSSDWLLVIGGLKAGTDVSFLGDTYVEEEYQIFKGLLEAEGLCVTDLGVTFRKSDIPFRQGTIYNPVTLVEQTSNSTLVPPFSPDNTLDQWIDNCTNQGINPDVVWGKIYSFPDSAIKDFVKRDKAQPKYRLLEKVGIKKKACSNLGETYWYFVPPKNDVLQREQRKKSFFSGLSSDPRFLALTNSQTLMDSNIAWRDRLPDFIKKN